MKKIWAVWIRLRSRKWLSLSIDVLLIITVFSLVHSWNTHELPRGAQVPSLPVLQLEKLTADPGIPTGSTGVVYFFAPWCFYCRNSINNLDRLVSKGEVAWVRVVALDYSNVDEVQEFVAETGLKQPVLLGDAQTGRDWNIRAFPTYFVIDAKGRISSRSVGYSTRLGLWARIRLAQ